jgi:hypothetical protein
MTGDALIDGFGAVGRRSGSFNPKPVTSRLPVILPERSSIQSNVQFLRTKASLVKEDCSWGHDLVLLAKQLAARRTDFDLPTNLQMNYWIHIRMSGRCGRGGETPLPLCRFRRFQGFRALMNSLPFGTPRPVTLSQPGAVVRPLSVPKVSRYAVSSYSG